MGEAVRTGRSFQAVWMWGMVENRLYEALQLMWEKILADPEADFRGTLETHMHQLVERIQLTFLRNGDCSAFIAILCPNPHSPIPSPPSPYGEGGEGCRRKSGGVRGLGQSKLSSSKKSCHPNSTP